MSYTIPREDVANAGDPRDISANCSFYSNFNSAPQGVAALHYICESKNCLVSDSRTHITNALSGGALVYNRSEPMYTDNFLAITFISDSNEPSSLPSGTSGPAHELVSSGPAHAHNNYRKATIESDHTICAASYTLH